MHQVPRNPSAEATDITVNSSEGGREAECPSSVLSWEQEQDSLSKVISSRGGGRYSSEVEHEALSANPNTKPN